MTTAAQTVANRANAEKSTGPRTPEGKAKVAQNAVRHGLFARAAVLQGEDPQEFAEYREQLLEELYPDGTLEQVLAERVVSLSWRLQRAARSQNAAFEALYEKHTAGPQTVVGPPEPSPGLDPDEPADSGPTLGRMLVEDFAQEKVLERLLVYERRIESSLYRTMAELRKLRGQRESAGRRRRTIDEESVRDTHPTWRREPAGSVPAGYRDQERWEEGEKVGGSEARSVLPASVRTFSPSSIPPFPDGVSTNGPEVEEQSCETKPICVGPVAEPTPEAGSPRSTGILPVNVDHGRDAHATEPPDGVATNGAEAQGQSCGTKPICAGANRGRASYRPIFRRHG